MPRVVRPAAFSPSCPSAHLPLRTPDNAFLWSLSCALLGILLSAQKSAGAPEVIFSSPSAYGDVFVIDEQELRHLRFDNAAGDDQSTIHRGDPHLVPMEYIRFAALGLAITPTPRRGLMVGLGAGTFASLMLRSVPELKMDAVEINPVVAKVAERFFGLRPGPRLKVHIQDGAAFLKKQKAVYDFIFLDAYTGESIPVHLATEDFLLDVRHHLLPGGVAVMNLAVTQPLENQLVARFAAVFEGCALVRTPESDNVILLGTSDNALTKKQKLRTRVSRLEQTQDLGFSLLRIARRVRQCPAGPEQAAPKGSARPSPSRTSPTNP